MREEIREAPYPHRHGASRLAAWRPAPGQVPPPYQATTPAHLAAWRSGGAVRRVRHECGTALACLPVGEEGLRAAGVQWFS